MTVANVRLMIPDNAHYDRAQATGDAVTVEYQLSNYPIVLSSQRVYLAGVLQATPANYTIDTDLGLVTFTVAPGAGVAIVVTYQYLIFSDATLAVFLTVEDDITKRATALALETIASDQVMTLKVIKLLELTTDGAKVSEALLARAKLLREQAAAEDVTGAFDYAEQVTNVFTFRDRMYNEWLRGN